MAAFLIMEGLIIGVFSSMDSMLFYVFWESSLIPMLLIIGIWGGQNRVYASIKFFLYTFLGSVFMLVSLIYMYNLSGSFAISEMYTLPLTMAQQSWIFWAFLPCFRGKGAYVSCPYLATRCSRPSTNRWFCYSWRLLC